jgi:hypothetical protein
VKDGKKGKVLNRGLTMMLVGYSKDHAENVFQMFNPETSRIARSCNVIWLGKMYHTRQDADLTQQLPIVTVPISIHDAYVDAEIQKLEVATFPLSGKREVESNSSSEKANEWIMSKTRYGRAIGRKDGSYNPSTGNTIKWSDVVAAEVDDIENQVSNYYDILGIDENEVKVLQMLNDSVSEYINVGAGVGGGFTNTNKLCMMKCHEAINGPDGKKLKAEVKAEHGRMIKSGVFEKVKLSELPREVKIIDTTWALKKKSNGTLCGRINVKGFKQVEGQNFDASSISAPVTNGMTIKWVLALMLASGGIAHVVDAKGAFLHGKFNNGEKIYIKIPLGFEEFYDDDTVLLLKKCLYGLKQAAIAFYRKFLAAASKIGLKRSSADPCLNYKLEVKRLVIMISWIDDNMIVGPSDLVSKLKSNLMEQFECNGYGVLTEYIGNKIERVGEDAIRLVQTVLTQSYEDEFELGNRCYNTPAQPGTVLMHPVEGKEILNPEDQTTLRSGVGKLMYQIQYLRPDIAQAVQDLARYMSCRNLKTLEAMKRCMRYVLYIRDARLLLKPS